MTILAKRNLPESLTKFLPSGYRKRSVIVYERNFALPYGWYWSGGSKTNWTHFQNGKVQPIDLPSFPFNKKPPEIPLNENSVVVSHGISCGKTATACIYVHDMSYYGLNLP